MVSYSHASTSKEVPRQADIGGRECFFLFFYFFCIRPEFYCLLFLFFFLFVSFWLVCLSRFFLGWDWDHLVVIVRGSYSTIHTIIYLFFFCGSVALVLFGISRVSELRLLASS